MLKQYTNLPQSTYINFSLSAAQNLRNLEGYLKQSFRYSGAFLWNNLPQEMRDNDSIGYFKRKIVNRIYDISDSHTIIM